MEHHFVRLDRERKEITAALAANVRRTAEIAEGYDAVDKRLIQRPILLRMAEGLIAAHKAAKVDDDGRTLDLIEEALRHVGERLSKECPDGRSFAKKRIAPVR